MIDWQGNEVTLLHGGETQRIDRLVSHRDSGEWWALDCNSAHRPEEQPGLIGQMNRYRDAVRNSNRGAVVRVAFLTGEVRVVEVGEEGAALRIWSPSIPSNRYGHTTRTWPFKPLRRHRT